MIPEVAGSIPVAHPTNATLPRLNADADADNDDCVVRPDRAGRVGCETLAPPSPKYLFFNRILVLRHPLGRLDSSDLPRDSPTPIALKSEGSQ